MYVRTYIRTEEIEERVESLGLRYCGRIHKPLSAPLMCHEGCTHPLCVEESNKVHCVCVCVHIGRGRLLCVYI